MSQESGSQFTRILDELNNMVHECIGLREQIQADAEQIDGLEKTIAKKNRYIRSLQLLLRSCEDRIN